MNLTTGKNLSAYILNFVIPGSGFLVIERSRGIMKFVCWFVPIIIVNIFRPTIGLILVLPVAMASTVHLYMSLHKNGQMQTIQNGNASTPSETQIKKLPIWFWCVLGLSALPILAWPFALFMSAFAFDDPGNPFYIVLPIVLLILAYPLGILLLLRHATRLYRDKNRRILGTLLGILPFSLVLTFTLFTFAASIDQELDLDSFQSDNEKALIKACSKNSTEKIINLIRQGVDPNICGYSGMTPLRAAFESRSLDAFRTLLEKGANPNLIPRYSFYDNIAVLILSNPTIDWNEKGIPYVTLLFDHGLDPNLHDRVDAILHWAASARNSAYLELFISRGADINLTTRIKRFDGTYLEKTPLDNAVSNHRWRNVLILLNKPEIKGREAAARIMEKEIPVNGKYFMDGPERHEVLKTFARLGRPINNQRPAGDGTE